MFSDADPISGELTLRLDPGKRVEHLGVKVRPLPRKVAAQGQRRGSRAGNAHAPRPVHLRHISTESCTQRRCACWPARAPRSRALSPGARQIEFIGVIEMFYGNYHEVTTPLPPPLTLLSQRHSMPCRLPHRTDFFSSISVLCLICVLSSFLTPPRARAVHESGARPRRARRASGHKVLPIRLLKCRQAVRLLQWCARQHDISKPAVPCPAPHRYGRARSDILPPASPHETRIVFLSTLFRGALAPR